MLSKMGTIGDKPVDSDSVNLGSNPSSPATIKAHETGLSGDFGPVERPAKSEQTEYARSTEPGTVSDSEIPTEPKAFERWLKAEDWMSWPEPLIRLASKYMLALIDRRDDPRWATDYEFRKPRIATGPAFLTAYAAYRAEVVR